MTHIQLYQVSRKVRWGQLLAMVLALLLFPAVSQCQNPDYDEISVTLNVQRIGSIEVPAVIYNEMAYLPLKDVFEFLKIKSSISKNLDTVKGFFLVPDAAFLLDQVANTFFYKGSQVALNEEFVLKTETNLYLKSTYLEKLLAWTAPLILEACQ